MTLNIDVIEYRGEHQVVVDRSGWPLEVIFRAAADPDALRFVEAALECISIGLGRGMRGWPFGDLDQRRPMFFIRGVRGVGWQVVLRHPRWSALDRMLYETPGEVDADLAMVGLRRAATLGALEFHGLTPKEERRWTASPEARYSLLQTSSSGQVEEPTPQNNAARSSPKWTLPPPTDCKTPAGGSTVASST